MQYIYLSKLSENYCSTKLRLTNYYNSLKYEIIFNIKFYNNKIMKIYTKLLKLIIKT